MDLPPTSLIIPSRNRPDLLLQTVRSVLEEVDVPTEIVIVDQSTVVHSVLSTLQSDRMCQVRYVWTPTVGVSRARNSGIAAAQHDILLFTDDDMSVTPQWFRWLVRSLLRIPAAQCGGRPGIAGSRIWT